MHERKQRERKARLRVRRLGLWQADAELLRVLDDDFGEARRRAGSWLVCEPGCAACCHGPFPITRLDGFRLRRGLAALRVRDPGRAEAIDRRARQAVDHLRSGFPGEPAAGRLSQDEGVLDPFFERHADQACPVLDPATRRCELYESRPVSCRTYGPPLRFGRKKSPPCRLCFRGAPDDVVERCRVEPDRDGIEQALLAHVGAAADEEWETTIAHALIRNEVDS